MLFSQKNDKKDATKSSLLGTLFNPRLGDDIKPLAHETKMFVRLLAMVLAGCGLFPANHPGLLDEKAPLSFAEVIRVSWSRLSFTRDGIPQIVLFAAVFGCLIFSFLFVVTLLFSILVPQAHAAETSSIFTSPATADWGNAWLRYIFYGEAISISNHADASVSGCSMQSAIGAMLSFYSSAILVLAGIILLYHLTTMIIDTARTGKFMGEANQVWAPIRLVIAIGLLVPIATSSGSSSSCNIGGYNTAQYIVIKVAEMGSGLASQTWNIFLSALTNAEVSSTCTNGSPSCVKTPPAAREFATRMINNYACALIYNTNLGNVYGSQSVIDTITENAGAPVTTVTSIDFSDTTKVETYNFGALFQNKLQYCGGLEVLPVPQGVYKGVYYAQLKVVNTYLPKFQEFAANTYSYYAHADVDQDRASKAMAKAETLIAGFEDALKSAISSSVATGDSETARIISGTTSTTTSTNDSSFKENGWLTAGAWFNTIARLASDRSSSIHNGVPTALSPKLGADGADDTKGVKSVKARTVEQMKRYSDALGYKISTDGLASSTKVAASGFDQKSLTQRFLAFVNPVDFLFSLIELGGYITGIWDSTGALSLKFDKTQNPLQELAAFGQGFITAGTWMLTTGALATTIGASVEAVRSGGAGMVASFFSAGMTDLGGGALSSGLKMIGSLLISLSVLFFTIGFTLGFVLPLFPFFRFFFGSLTWIVAVFEAIVAMPLFALAHLTPHGNGLMGNGAAKRGYFQLLQILLRPTLMIFGLVAGFILFAVAISFLNAVFAIAAAGTGNLTGGTPALARVLYAVIYCALAYICANKCFQTIGMFPQHALTWLGGNAHEERMGDTGTIGAVGSAMVAKGLASPLSSAAGAGGNAISGAAKRRVDAKNLADTTKEKEAGAELATTRHDEMMGRLGGGSGAGGGQQANLTKPEEKTPGYTKDEKTNLLLSNTTSTKTEEMHKAYDDGTNSGLGNRGRTVFGENGQPKTPGGGGGRSNTDGNKNV